VANPKERSAGRIRAPMPVRNGWGRELSCAAEEQYAGKLLLVNKGHALSFQGHALETIYLQSGTLWFSLNGHEFELVPGASLTIEEGDAAYFQALEDSAILEIGTGRLANLVHLETG
jgi:quercetin dioxygenase-like cupin family protein